MLRSIGWQELIILAVIIGLVAIPIWLFYRIFSRTGMSPGFAFLVLVPYAGPLIVLFMLAFSRWPAVDGQLGMASSQGFAASPAPSPPAPSQMAAPAGWLPDPTGQHQLRYWDGAKWTESVHDDGASS